jgi:hypothetical protein
MVDGIDDPTKLALSDAMSYIVEGHEHMGAGQNGWDGRSTLYDWTSGKFPAGFVPTALAILHQRGYTPQIHRHPLPAPLGPLPTPDAPLVDNFPATTTATISSRPSRSWRSMGATSLGSRRVVVSRASLRSASLA